MENPYTPPLSGNRADVSDSVDSPKVVRWFLRFSLVRLMATPLFAAVVFSPLEVHYDLRLVLLEAIFSGFCAGWVFAHSRANSWFCRLVVMGLLLGIGTQAYNVYLTDTSKHLYLRITFVLWRVGWLFALLVAFRRRTQREGRLCFSESAVVQADP